MGDRKEVGFAGDAADNIASLAVGGAVGAVADGAEVVGAVGAGKAQHRG